MTTQHEIEERRFADRKTMVQQLSDEVARRLSEAVDQRGHAFLVVSGGHTPKALFDVLSHRRLPWSQIGITLADERWVGPESEQSNEHLVRSYLLQDAAAAASFVPLKTSADTPEAGQAECNTRLASCHRPFDLVLLGIGGDGHTASLIPGAPELSCLLAPKGNVLCGASRPPSMANPRMSMTLPCLLDARAIIFHLFGDDKWSVYQRALQGGSEREMPVRGVLARRGEIPQAVFWAP